MTPAETALVTDPCVCASFYDDAISKVDERLTHDRMKLISITHAFTGR
jgi:hypothetical protein